RIGGTPCVLVGLASVKRSSRRDAALRALVNDELRRAVLAFPDEDVLIGAKFSDPAGLQALKGLQDVVPRPGHKATGEERAWRRRLAKRFGAEVVSTTARSCLPVTTIRPACSTTTRRSPTASTPRRPVSST